MDFSNKKILFMGDSITAIGGWVSRFNSIIKPQAFVNIAVCGATWQDRFQTVYDGNPKCTATNVNNTICNQIEKLLRGKDSEHEHYNFVHEYSNFDIIIIAAGTNDPEMKGLYKDGEKIIREQFFTENGEILPLDNVDRKTWPGAMRYAYENLRRIYPTAEIFYCTPIQAADDSRTFEGINARRKYMKKICDRISNVTVIDTFCCGICGIYEIKGANGRDLVDGLHPNKSGNEKIARYNARAIKQFYL